MGAFVASASGVITTIARPGNPAPGGGTFVAAGNYTSINDAGDVAFSGHTTLDGPDTWRVYVKRAATGTIELIPQPSGIVATANHSINNRGDVAFGGAIVPFPNGSGIGNMYLRRGTNTITVAALNGPAPGGGTFSAATVIVLVPRRK